MSFQHFRLEHDRLKRVLGPWTKHEHSYGCECGSYPANSLYRGVWWYRLTVDGEEGVTAISDEDMQTQDVQLREKGFILCDEA